MGWGKKSEQELVAEKVNELLDKMEVPELRELCKSLIGSFPKHGLSLEPNNHKLSFVDPITRSDYDTFLQYYYKRKEITYDSLKNYLIRHKFTTERDFKFESDEKDSDEKNKGNGGKTDFESFIDLVQREFRPEKVYDEKELQNALRQFFQNKFPNVTVQREVPLKKYDDNVDIILNGTYAFECKIPEKRTILRDLKAQLEEYKEEYSDICAVILDISGGSLSQQILEYCKKYAESGIRSVVIEGSKRN